MKPKLMTGKNNVQIKYDIENQGTEKKLLNNMGYD